MRKQTKLVAVLSAAALLAIGATMTSFAATGWQAENGTWVYYDKNGDQVTESWQKSANNWFYLNEDGEMATDSLIEDNDNYYYVNDSGVMITNAWVSVTNDDYDGSEDEPTNYWYYFQANGKALKSSANGSTASFKTINGKKYIFNDEAHMLYGWIGADGQRQTGDDAWRDGIYYCGDENDGAQALGWKELHIVDNNYDGTGVGMSSNNLFDDEEQDRFFYFNTNGKKFTNEKGKTINGKKYSFDEDGRMNAEWVQWDATPSNDKASQGNATYTEGFRYYGSPESGARVTKGWFQVVPDSYLSVDDYEDDSSNWYYSDKDGKLVAGKMTTINGKKYAFNDSGKMQSGLKFIKAGDTTNEIADIKADDNDTAKFDTEAGFKENAPTWLAAEYKLYYFGEGSDGAMKTNKQNVTIDGDSFSFLFNKSGSFKGAGKTGVDSDKYYLAGMLLQADKDDKYSVIKITKDDKKEITKLEVLTTDDFLDEMGVENTVSSDSTKYTEYYDVKDAAKDAADTEYRLVNTAGTVQKSKNKAKDGSERCFTVDSSKQITTVFVED